MASQLPLINLLIPAHGISSHLGDGSDASSLSPSLTQTGFDLDPVLAVDVSPSMDVEELTLQRQGFIEASRSPEVQEAVRKDSAGRIVVMYVEWAGSSIHQGRHTSISAVIDFGIRQLQVAAVRATRQAIDISGTGRTTKAGWSPWLETRSWPITSPSTDCRSC
jgi:hypothetical protein